MWNGESLECREDGTKLGLCRRSSSGILKASREGTFRQGAVPKTQAFLHGCSTAADVIGRSQPDFFREEKQKIGRPSYGYYLTEKGHEEFERDYANLVSDLFGSIRSIDGQEKINQVFEERKREYVERCRGKVLEKTLEARVPEVTRLLSEDGYMASWERLGPNKYLIKEMNCAVAQVAKRFPEICIFEEVFLP